MKIFDNESFSERIEIIHRQLDLIREVVKTTPGVLDEIDAAIQAESLYQFYTAISHLYVGFSEADILGLRHYVAGEGTVDFTSPDFPRHIHQAKYLINERLEYLKGLEKFLESKVKQYAH